MGIRTPDLLHAIRLRRGSGRVRKGVSGQFTWDDARSKSLGGSRSAWRMADRLADGTSRLLASTAAWLAERAPAGSGLMHQLHDLARPRHHRSVPMIDVRS